LMRMIGGRPTVASHERSFVLALFNYFEVTFWFAVWYSMLVRWGSLHVGFSPHFVASLPGPLAIFRESLAMMLVNTSNTFDATPSRLAWSAMCVQSVVGLFLTLVVIARTVASIWKLTPSSAATTAHGDSRRVHSRQCVGTQSSRNAPSVHLKSLAASPRAGRNIGGHRADRPKPKPQRRRPRAAVRAISSMLFP